MPMQAASQELQMEMQKPQETALSMPCQTGQMSEVILPNGAARVQAAPTGLSGAACKKLASGRRDCRLKMECGCVL